MQLREADLRVDKSASFDPTFRRLHTVAAVTLPPPHARISKAIRLAPIVFFELYLTATVLIFVFGPWEFPLDDPTKLYVFLTLAHIALLLGYLTAAFKEPRGYHGRASVSQLVLLCLLVNLAVMLPTSALYTGSVVPDVGGALANPGDAYLNSQNVRETTVPVIAYLRMFVGPFIYGLLPLTVFFWRELSPTLRWGSIFATLGVIATFIAMGTNKAIIDTILQTGALLTAGVLSGRMRIRWRRHLTALVALVLSFVLFIGFFAEGQKTRHGSPAEGGSFPAANATVDFEEGIVADLPPDLQIGYLGLTLYLTGGYYAVYLSLDKPFVPNWGVGNSMFLFRQAARILGNPELEERPYPVRIEVDGWDSFKFWSTIYPWLASDVSFPGTLLVVFLIGRGLAMTWLDTLRGVNPFAVAMFVQFVIMLFYFPANNQCMQSGECLTAFWTTLIMWVRTRRPAQASGAVEVR